jgi:hypothetical protein
MGTEGSFTGKVAKADLLPPTGAKVRMAGAILPLPLYVLMASIGQLHILPFLFDLYHS